MKTLLLLGGSHFYRPIIPLAHQLGLRVVLADRDENVVGRPDADVFEKADIADDKAVLAVARRHRVDAVLAVNDWGLKTAASVAETLNLKGTSTAVAEASTNKRLMRMLWQKAGCPIPEFAVTRNVTEAAQAAEKIGFPVILKASDNMGASRGVMRVENKASLETAYPYCLKCSFDQTVLVEQLVTGSEHSVETLSIDGEVHVLTISDKIKGPFPHRVDKAVLYPTHLDARARGQAVSAASEAVRALGITSGPAHTELCVTADGPIIFETAARGAGGRIFPDIVRLVTGVDFAKETIRQLLGERPDVNSTVSLAAGLGFIMPPPGRVVSVDGIQEAAKLPFVFACESFKKVGEVVREVRSGGDRAGYFVVTAEHRDGVDERYRQVDAMELILTEAEK